MATNYFYLLFIFLPLTLSVIEAQNGGFSVDLIYRDSPKSPFYKPNETPFQRLNNSFHRSFNRFKQFYPQTSLSLNTPQSEITSKAGEYLMKYSIGTPPFSVMGIADTGSDLTWSQCIPCNRCYNQTDPMFDPSKSSTYQLVPCSNALCKSVPNSFCDKGPTCMYSVSYADGSHSLGNLAFDTLTLGSTTGSPIVFPNISFGCGFDDAGTFDSHESGIVGLGAGNLSLISQLGPSINSKFSYCLVPLVESQATSKINFGQNAIVDGPGAVSTPIVYKDDATFYYLTLEAISVGKKRINYVDSLTTFSKGNIIIDSGTTLTILPQDFYTKLESEVASQAQLERVVSPDKALSLCFKCTSQAREVLPILTVHFTGADVELVMQNAFVRPSNDSVCLAFAASGGGAVFGNVAQRNYLVGYDLQKKSVTFKSTDCTKM